MRSFFLISGLVKIWVILLSMLTPQFRKTLDHISNGRPDAMSGARFLSFLPTAGGATALTASCDALAVLIVVDRL